MKIKAIIFVIGAVVILASFRLNSAHSTNLTIISALQNDSIKTLNKKFVAQVMEQIKGQEEKPSSEVFVNIEQFANVPAGRLLRIMEMGYSNSLGVSCAHCHNTNDFASDSKAPKKIARAMREMVNKINGELLPSIKDITSEKPTVNCTTCHRGKVKPSLNLEN